MAESRAMPAKRMSTTAQTIAAASNNNSNTTAGSAPAAVAPSNNSLNGMTRLTPARDLTLGGRGAGGGTKKVFAPNLNAVRNKNTNVKTSKDFTQPRGGRRGGRGAGASTRGRGGIGNANSTLIQTTGVFSEGAGAVHLRKSSSGGSAYARAGDEVALSRKRNERKDDKSQDPRMQQILDDATSDEDEPASESEADKTELDLKPVLLSEGLWQNKQLNVKQESMTIPSANVDKSESVAVTEKLLNLHVGVQAGLEEPPAQYGRYPRSINAFLDVPQSQLFVLQLPNVLPCVEDDAEETPAATEQPTAGVSTELPNSPLPNLAAATPKHSVLTQLEEGQIGKILRYRSGRVKLLLGETRFDLDMGLESGFLQELMSISSNREQRSGNMINLGPIQAKLKATPDWVHLFEQQEAAARIPSTTSLPVQGNSTSVA